MAALKTVFENGDTNSFWKLHCWNNVPPVYEKTWKATSVDPFALRKEAAFTGFEIRDVPADYNKPRKLSRGTVVQANIPATGQIVYQMKGINVDVSQGLAFGKGPDGNYWLVVTTGSTNAVPGRPSK